MKQKLALLVMASALAGSMAFTLPASAETAQVGQVAKLAQLKLETQPKKPGVPKPGGQGASQGFKADIKKTGPGSMTLPLPITHNCMPGYSKTKYLEYQGGTQGGALHTMDCRSPIFECPHKSKVKGDNGVAANGQGIKVKKVAVGAGDSNRFKIEYTCNYYWNQG